MAPQVLMWLPKHEIMSLVQHVRAQTVIDDLAINTFYICHFDRTRELTVNVNTTVHKTAE
jgi:hypothetical protein